MKKIITIALLALVAQIATAATMGTSILNIRLNDGAPFKLIMDGQVNADGAQSARIENIPGGQHFVQVYRIDNSWGYETMDNAYRGYITLTGNTENFVTVLGDIQKLSFDRIVAINAIPQMPAGQPMCNKPVQGGKMLKPVICMPQSAPVTPAGPMAMSGYNFDQLRDAICNGTFESTKLSIFKQALAYNYFNTQQVCSLLALFTFDSTKLEVAKLAYNKTIDQCNYYQVNSQFTFSSSVNELGEYVAMR